MLTTVLWFRRRVKYMNKSIAVYLLLLVLALVVFSIPWYSGHYGYPSYEETNVNGWDLIEWQWNKTLDDSSFPYLIGICIGIIAIATWKYHPVPLFITIIAGAFMLFVIWQCLIAGYNGPRELTLQPPEVIKAGGVLAFIVPVAYMVIGSILCLNSRVSNKEYKVAPKTT